MKKQGNRIIKAIAISKMALSRDPCNFRQDGLKSIIPSGFDDLLHSDQKSHVW
jgi:hypothetical protein